MENKSICFAYFGDNQFLGWYADSFGSIRLSPKLYSNTEHQKGVITKNFRYKVEKALKDEKLNSEKLISKHNEYAGALLGVGLRDDEATLSKYEDVELRVVECPEYSGPNPDFDKDAWDIERAKRREIFNKEEKEYNIPDGYSKERCEFVNEFDARHPELNKRPDNWIYCDYKKVTEWASNEPTEFLETIKTQE